MSLLPLAAHALKSALKTQCATVCTYPLKGACTLYPPPGS